MPQEQQVGPECSPGTVVEGGDDGWMVGAGFKIIWSRFHHHIKERWRLVHLQGSFGLHF